MNKALLILLLVAGLTGCVPSHFSFQQTPIRNRIPDGQYRIGDLAYYYWGYNIDLTVADGKGVARIKDVRSTFAITDTLTYQSSAEGKQQDRFAGKYLSFEHSDRRGWILRLSNPVSGDQFVGEYEFK